jgi:hypothetical protein
MTHSMTTAARDRAPAPGRQLLVDALLLGSRLLAALAGHLTRTSPAGATFVGREFHVVERDGQLVGLLYDGGRLVATLPGVGRL